MLLSSLIFVLLLIYLGRDFERRLSLREKRRSIVYLGVLWLSITFGITLNLTLFILFPRYSLSSGFDAAQFIATSAAFSLAYWVVISPPPSPSSVANKIKAMQLESSLTKNLVELLDKAGLRRNKILLENYGDLAIHNAYVKLDFKPFKFVYRIRLSNGIASSGEYSLEEKMMILAHEIGHIKIFKRYILFAFLTLFTSFIISQLMLSYMVTQLFNSGFNLLDIYLPFISTLAIIFIAIYNALKRRVELQADQEALKYGENSKALASALHKIYSKKHNRSNTLINLIFQDHPSLNERIKKIWTANI
jgi:hypothetical protein